MSEFKLSTEKEFTLSKHRSNIIVSTQLSKFNIYLAYGI